MKKKRGRPKVKEPVKSFTVSLTLTQKKKLKDRYGSLTEAVKSAL